MRKWLATKQAAWGEALVFMAIGGIAAYLKYQIGIPILLVLLILGAYLIRRAYKQEATEQNKQEVTEQTSVLYNINPTLQKMEQRLLQLAQKEKNKNIDWERYLAFNREINLGILGIVPSKAKTVRKAQIAVSKIESSSMKKYSTQPDNIYDLLKSELFSRWYKASLIQDNRGFGLKEQKEADKKKYLKLSNMLDDYRNLTTPKLNWLIENHIKCAEIEANMLLVKYRGLRLKARVKGNEISFMDLLPLEGQADIEGLDKGLRELTSKIRAEIIKCIQGLEKSPVVTGVTTLH